MKDFVNALKTDQPMQFLLHLHTVTGSNASALVRSLSETLISLCSDQNTAIISLVSISVTSLFSLKHKCRVRPQNIRMLKRIIRRLVNSSSGYTNKHAKTAVFPYRRTAKKLTQKKFTTNPRAIPSL